jgi:hypothetical protein
MPRHHQSRQAHLPNVIIVVRQNRQQKEKHMPTINERLGDIQNQLIEQDGKFVGLQTEMRQRFNETDQRFTTLETTLAQILARLPENPPQSK